MRLARIVLLPLLALAPAVLAPSAGASTIVGLDFGEQASGAKCEGGAGLTTSVPKGVRDYTVPAGSWVVTTWGTSTGADAGSAELKVFRPLHEPDEGAETYLVIGADGPYPVAANTAPSYPTREPIRVQGGDMVGLAASETNCQYFLPGQEAFAFEEFRPGSNPPTGFSGTFASIEKERGLQVTATLEPDEDGDGFGDETQDACPKDPAARAMPCPVPVVPPVAPPAVPDVRRPSVRVVDRAERGLGARAVLATFRIDEPVSYTATGTISIEGGSKVSLGPVVGTTDAAVSGLVIRLPFRKRLARRIQGALAVGKQVSAKMTVTAFDQAGNRGQAGFISTTARIMPKKPTKGSR